MRPTPRAWFAIACCLWLGCGAKTKFKLPEAQGVSSVVREDAGADRTAECDGAEKGKPCGQPGGHLHCVFNVCVRNACGDGVAAETEECDDGNQRDLDGCDSHCHAEPPPGCGNNVVEAGEACDDGNQSDDDACTHLCTKSRCGDHIKGLGEECDDGNTFDNDGCTTRCTIVGGAAGASGSAGTSAPSAGAGTGASGAAAASGSAANGSAGMRSAAAGSAGTNTGVAGTSSGAAGSAGMSSGAAGSAGTNSGVAGTSSGAAGSAGMSSGAAGASAAGPSAECSACRSTNCRDFMGLGADLVAGCYDKVDPIGGADPSDSKFLQDCQGVMQCAYQGNCAYGPTGATVCYCGSASVDQCMQSGPASDAKCVDAFKAATRSMDSSEISARTTNFAYPMAWAYYLLECDRDLCSSQCVPK
jgi:cysteine-rich repeat protein